MNFAAIVRDTNLTAVRSLKDGDIEEAVDLWNGTLEGLRSSLYDAGEESVNLFTSPGIFCEKQFLQSTPMMSEEEANRHNIHTGNFAFYDKVFLLDDLHRPSVNLPHDIQVAVTTSVVLYNMAAATHLQGLLNGKIAYLTKALKLYSLSHQVIKDEAIHFAPTLKVMVLALFNNAGHIHNEFMNAVGIWHSQKGLVATLSSMDHSQMSESDIDFFHVNMLIFQNQGILRNAPAA